MIQYVKVAHRASYNCVFAGVLVLLYEGILLLTPDTGTPRTVNLIDAWLDSLLAVVPYSTWIISGALLLLTIFFVFRDRQRGEPLHGWYIFYMWLESIGWGLFIYLNITLLVSFLPVPNQLDDVTGGEQQTLLYQLGLCFGAGFYEELFFRLVLVWVFIWLLKAAAPELNRWTKHVLIVLVTAVLFSLAHHIPPHGEPFDLYVFSFRAVFGVLMSILLLLRGFGITAWTHALYDVIVVLRDF
jgi:membrane protease YdiL (CAAX protease family)